MHTIPIISIIHIIHTIHMKCNYHTYHTYNSIHTIAYIQYQPLMPYIPYLPYIPNIPYFPNMPYQTDHTHHTYPTYHATPPPHHRGGKGQYHTPTTPQGGRGTVLGPQVAPPFPSICKLLAAFLRSSFVFARSLRHFWLPASHLLGTCYLLGDLRSTHTPSKYLRATYSHTYMCYVSTVSTSCLLPVYSDNTTCV